MKPRTWKFYILPIGFAALPWLFWAINLFHPPDHADVFWMVGMPLVFVTCSPIFVLPTPPDAFLPFWQIVISSALDFGVVFAACAIFTAPLRKP